MTLGNTNPATLNSNVSNMAVQLRDHMTRVNQFAMWFNDLSLTDVETLFALSAADAASMQNMVSYMNNIALVYFGQIQQGGSGGTGAILFNFNQALSILWGGQ